MSLCIIDRGEGRYDLCRGDREIGWIEDRRIGFHGFESRAAARHAATIAYDALSVWLAKQRHAAPPPRNGRSLIVRRDGDEQQLIVGDVVVGRLLSTSPDVGANGDRGCAFELLLPPRLGSTLSAAQVAYNAQDRRRVLRDAAFAGATS